MGEKNKKQKKAGFMGRIANFIKSRLFSVILAVIHMLLTIGLLSIVLYINMLPVHFFIPICFVLFLLWGIAFLMAYSKKLKYVGKLISLIMIIISSVAVYFAILASDAFEGMSGANTKKDVVNVYVMKADKAQDLTSAQDYTFGILEVLDRENTDKTVDEIETKLGKTIDKREYEGYTQLAEALYSGEVQAIILNSAYVTNLTETEEYASFTTLTKILMKTTHETELTVDNTIEVNKTAFTMYLSGIDIEGEVSTTSRSDVNIIAVINPETRQVLLVNTPRDYYIPLSISRGTEDKLTHAGLYGIDVSMDTLEMLYDIKLDYFFRINFTGFEELIDALGGVNVYSEYSFTSLHGGDRFVKGYNQMNGKQALGFVRERYSFAEGDNQRGKNQMELIKAIVDKVASTAILNDFTGLMDSISGSFETSMSSSQISSLVRMQLSEGGSWNVLSYAVSGSEAKMPVYSMSSEVYVTIPDMDTVEKAQKLIDMVYDGEILSEEIIENLDNNQEESLRNRTSEGD